MTSWGDFAEKVGAQYLIKGIRSSIDFDYEKATQRVMEDSFPELETMYVIPPREQEHISSTLVRGFLDLPKKEILVSPYISNLTNFAIFRYSSHGVSYQIYYLKNAWDIIYARSKRTSFKKKELWDAEFCKLMNLYASKDRYYHTIDHLYDCIEMVNRTGGVNIELWLALFYHDAIYDPKRGDNKNRSSELADEFLKRVGLNLTIRNKVRKLIMATTHKNPPTDGEEAVIMEIDTAIFADSAKFWPYERNIRSEYLHVPEKKYAKVRSGILQGFIDRGIYYGFLNDLNYEVADMHLKQAIEKLQGVLKE